MDNKERSNFIKNLVEIFNKNNLNSLEFKDGDLELKLKKNTDNVLLNSQVMPQQHAVNVVPQVPQPTISPAPAPEDLKTNVVATTSDYSSHEGAVKSPTVGIVYLSSSPDKPAFVTKGASVKAGDTLFLLEVMKVFNPIKAHKDGVVKEILVKNGNVVEYNEVLAIIE